LFETRSLISINDTNTSDEARVEELHTHTPKISITRNILFNISIVSLKQVLNGKQIRLSLQLNTRYLFILTHCRKSCSYFIFLSCFQFKYL